jgi:polar amino acid transport system substrate-binding protein
MASGLPAVADTDVIELNTTTYPPLSTPEQQGFLDRIVKEALARLGITMKTVRLPAERALIDANHGILDGEISRVAGLENIYPNLVRIPEKLMDLEFTLFSRHVVHLELEPRWQALTPYSTAIINGWKILENNMPAGAEVTKVKSPMQLFNLLNLDRVDLIIYERWGGMALIKEMNVSNIRRLTPPLVVKGMYMYLNKKHQALVPRLNDALRQIKQDGTYQRIYKQTLGRFEQH